MMSSIAILDWPEHSARISHLLIRAFEWPSAHTEIYRMRFKERGAAIPPRGKTTMNGSRGAPGRSHFQRPGLLLRELCLNNYVVRWDVHYGSFHRSAPPAIERSKLRAVISNVFQSHFHFEQS